MTNPTGAQVSVEQSDREALLPCPFCGGEASTYNYETESLWSHNQVTYTHVGCEACDYSRSTEPGYEIEAPQWWNTRLAATQPPAREEWPAGWKLVPERVTVEMIAAWGRDVKMSLQQAYQAMIAASPTPPATGGTTDAE